MLRDLDLLYVITWRVDAEVEKVMRSVELGSLFALSWPLTWFSHALHHYKQVGYELVPLYCSNIFVKVFWMELIYSLICGHGVTVGMR